MKRIRGVDVSSEKKTARITIEYDADGSGPVFVRTVAGMSEYWVSLGDEAFEELWRQVALARRARAEARQVPA